MTVTEPAPISPRAKRVRARKAHADREKARRAKQKQRFLEALALLSQISDDDVVIIAPPGSD